MKFCANLSFMFTEGATVLERYALAKDAGFKAVETGFPLGFSIDQVKKAKENAGVEQVLINLKTGDLAKGELGVTAVPGKENEFKENLKTTIDYAKALGVRKVHIMSGKVDHVTPENWEVFEKNLNYAANELKKYELLGVIEPINQHTVPKYFLSDYGKAVEIIKRIGCENLKLQLDIFHLQHIIGDLSYNIKELMPYVGHVQVTWASLVMKMQIYGELQPEIPQKPWLRGWPTNGQKP
ncbi:putative hydroxypyruvate isomerase isoform X4 [Leptidea sinapis]|uniref:putative hydroxypyruvate isomerase isoform X4 n=1 Tax=Leptidea sinapis TaxID=189913 RepID=UPI002135B398|nr:putative hydroxypyruvate isomerase isoform X4 [Leptidea sinapis]